MYFWLLILLLILHFNKGSVVVVMPIVTGGSDDGDEGDGADGGGQVESLGSPSSSNQPGKPNRKPVRLTRKKHRALANKPQDFQVLFEFWLLRSWEVYYEASLVCSRAMLTLKPGFPVSQKWLFSPG